LLYDANCFEHSRRTSTHTLAEGETVLIYDRGNILTIPFGPAGDPLSGGGVGLLPGVFGRMRGQPSRGERVNEYAPPTVLLEDFRRVAFVGLALRGRRDRRSPCDEKRRQETRT